jgi:hypothetical protein
MDKIREYKSKYRHLEELLILAQNISKSWREFYKHKQMYGKGDMTAFPNLKFERSPI